MSRVCIIGNSHLGAYKLAVSADDTAGLADRFEFDTFGSIRASILQSRIEGTRLVPTRKDVADSFERTSGGQGEIALGSYDAIVLAIRNSPYWIRPYLFDTRIGPVTDTMVAAIHAAFLDDWSIELTAAIARAVPKARVFFVGRPLNSQKDFLANRVLPQFEGQTGPTAEAIKDRILLSLNAAAANSPVAPNVTVVRPPDHLLEPQRLFTLSRYSRGAAKAETGMRQVFKEDDTQHMNGDYGREMLLHMLADL